MAKSIQDDQAVTDKTDERSTMSNKGQKRSARSGADNLSAEDKNSNLYKLLAEYNGAGNVDGEMFSQLSSFVRVNSAKKTKDGFKVDLYDGSSIECNSARRKDGSAYDSISASSENFTPAQANAMVALGRAQGWTKAFIEGPEKNKEMLWLATQRQALHERGMQLSGSMPEGPLPEVINFKPSKESDTFKTWLKEKAEWEKAHGQKFSEAAAPEAPGVQATARNGANAPRDKVPGAPGEKLGSRFVADKPAAASPRGTAPVKTAPVRPRSRRHHKPGDLI